MRRITAYQFVPTLGYSVIAFAENNPECRSSLSSKLEWLAQNGVFNSQFIQRLVFGKAYPCVRKVSLIAADKPLGIAVVQFASLIVDCPNVVIGLVS